MSLFCWALFLVLTSSWLFCSKRSLGSSSSRAPAPSSSGAPVPGSSGAPVLAAPLLSQGGGDVFAAVVPPTRSSLCFTKKKIVG